MNRKKTIILGIISLIAIIVLVFGITYGYLNNNIQGNTNPNSVVVDVENSKLEYTDLSENSINRLIEPGFVDIKLFTVKNLGNVSATYHIYLTDVVHDFIRLSDLEYTLYRKSGNNTIDVTDFSDCTLVASGTYPKINSYLVLGEELEHANDIYTYALKVEYINSVENQDANKGKVFGGKVQINASSDPLPNADTLTYKILDNAIKGDNGTTFKVTPDTTPGSQISTENEKEISIALDDLGTSYYFRGNVTNNWVKFGKGTTYKRPNVSTEFTNLEECESNGTYTCETKVRDMLWRIVRINGDGTVRMVYSGTTDYHTDDYKRILTRARTRTSYYNSAPYNDAGISFFGNTDPAFVGYMYSINQTFKTSTNIVRNVTQSTEYTFFKLENFNEGSNCTTTEEDGKTIRTCYNYNSNDVLESTCTKITYNANYAIGYCTLIDNGNTLKSTWINKALTLDPDNEYKYVCIHNVATDENGNIKCPIVDKVYGTVVKANSPDTNNIDPAKISLISNGYISGQEGVNNVIDSTVKGEVDSWYQRNLYNTNYENYIADEIFCNNRKTTYTYNNINSINFEANARISGNMNLICPQVNDSFTVSDSLGNGDLTYPVGLLTFEDVKAAGIKYNTTNQNTYLASNSSSWTMTPTVYSLANYNIYVVYHSTTAYNAVPVGSRGIRPVINLKADSVYLRGDGTEQNPYEIEIEE